MVSIHGPLGYEPNTQTTAPLRSVKMNPRTPSTHTTKLKTSPCHSRTPPDALLPGRSGAGGQWPWNTRSITSSSVLFSLFSVLTVLLLMCHMLCVFSQCVHFYTWQRSAPRLWSNLGLDTFKIFVLHGLRQHQTTEASYTSANGGCPNKAGIQTHDEQQAGGANYVMVAGIADGVVFS